MIVINEPLLKEFRRAILCGFCHRAKPIQVHHIWAKGMGGGHRLDVRINLIPLCAECHGRCHDGHIPRCDILAMVAQREDTFSDAIESVIGWLKRMPKDADDDYRSHGWMLMNPRTESLARRVWSEICQARPDSKPSATRRSCGLKLKGRKGRSGDITF